MRLILALLVIAATGPARAEDWRFCLAQDESARHVYVSRPFATDRPIEALERDFNRWLDGNELSHSWGICPRAVSSFGPQHDVSAALAYNRGLGLKAVEVDWPPM